MACGKVIEKTTADQQYSTSGISSLMRGILSWRQNFHVDFQSLVFGIQLCCTIYNMCVYYVVASEKQEIAIILREDIEIPNKG